MDLARRRAASRITMKQHDTNPRCALLPEHERDKGLKQFVKFANDKL